MLPFKTRSDQRSRLIHAPAAEVFAAISRADRVARWRGPAGFTNTMHEFDFRPGGTWGLTRRVAALVADANEHNLERLTLEVQRHPG